MSDSKPKRAAREPARNDAAIADALAEATASVIEPAAAPQPEPASAIALAQAVPAGPACPVAAVPEGARTEETAAAADAWTAFAEAQSALARGFEKAAVEVTGIGSSGIAATADAAVALFGARTFAEALEINAGLARRGVDALLEGAARLSEIGATAMTDASRPLLSRFGREWGALGRH
jgi:hypothetical protein